MLTLYNIVIRHNVIRTEQGRPDNAGSTSGSHSTSYFRLVRQTPYNYQYGTFAD